MNFLLSFLGPLFRAVTDWLRDMRIESALREAGRLEARLKALKEAEDAEDRARAAARRAARSMPDDADPRDRANW